MYRSTKSATAARTASGASYDSVPMYAPTLALSREVTHLRPPLAADLFDERRRDVKEAIATYRECAAVIPYLQPDTVGEIRFICNLISPEDLAVVPSSEWVIASGNRAGGRIHLVSVRDKTATTLFPSATRSERLDAATYPTCPGPIDPNEGDAFNAHGLYLEPGQNAVHTLYVVHHGNRESIEVFEVNSRVRPTLTWIGCAIAPDPLGLNGGSSG